MPIKTFTASVLTAADVNDYLMEQVVITCTSGTRPSSPVNGMTIYETDTDCYVTYEGSAWAYALGGIWQNYTPTLTNITLGNGTISARWGRVGRTVHGSILFDAGSTTSYGAGNLGISGPVPAQQGGNIAGWGFVDNSTSPSRNIAVANLASASPARFELQVNGGTVSNTFPFAAGTATRIRFNFTYDMA